MKGQVLKYTYAILKILKKNLNKLHHYKEVMIEEYIGGREIQVAIMGQKKLGAIELVPKKKVFMIIKLSIILIQKLNISFQSKLKKLIK